MAGQNCTIAAKTVIAPGEEIPDLTVVYANNMRRKDKRDIMSTRNQVMLAQIEVLKRLIPSKPERFL
jgi:dynactin 6